MQASFMQSGLEDQLMQCGIKFMASHHTYSIDMVKLTV